MTPQTILSVKDLVVKLQIDRQTYTVVDRMSFDLFQGKTLALVGESGCGKSLTALSLLRILPTPPALPPEGEVLYKGENLLKISQKRLRSIRGAKISMIFQDPMSALNPVFTIGNQLVETACLHLGISYEEAWSLSTNLLKEVGIPNADERMHAYPHELSGGLRQRAMIAMALICNPDILIADEPTTALDVTIQAQVLELIRQQQRERGMALLLITHDMGVVSEMADEVIVMYCAQAIEHGKVNEIFDQCAHPYTLGLFQSLPSLKKKEKLIPIRGQVPPLNQIPSGCRFNPRCPYVMDKCLHGEVPNFTIEGSSHWAKCWLNE